MRISTALFLATAPFILSACVGGETKDAPIVETPDTKTEIKSLSKIMTDGGNAVCQITDLQDNSQITMAINGTKIKMSGASLAGEGQMGHMLYLDNMTYFWVEGQTTGFKLDNSAKLPDAAVTSAPVADIDTQVSSYEDTTQYQVKCDPYKATDVDFSVPTNVTFTNPQDMMSGLSLPQQ